MAAPAPAVSSFADLHKQATTSYDPYVSAPEAKYAHEDIKLDATGVDPSDLIKRLTAQVGLGVDAPRLLLVNGTPRVIHAIEEISDVPGLVSPWGGTLIGSDHSFLLGRPLECSLDPAEVFGETGKVTIHTFGYAKAKMALGNAGPLITSEPRKAEDKQEVRLYKSVGIPTEFEGVHDDPNSDLKTIFMEVHDIIKAKSMDVDNLPGHIKRYLEFICAMCYRDPNDAAKSIVEVTAPAPLAPCPVHSVARARRLEKIFEGRGIDVNFSGTSMPSQPAAASQDLTPLLGAVGDLATAVQSGNIAHKKEFNRRKDADAKAQATKIMKFVGGQYAYETLLKRLGHADISSAPEALREMVTAADKKSSVAIWRVQARKIAGELGYTDLLKGDGGIACINEDILASLLEGRAPCMDIEDVWTRPSYLNTFAFDGRSADEDSKEERRKARLKEYNVQLKETDVTKLVEQSITFPRASNVKEYYQRHLCAIQAIASPDHWLVKFLKDFLETMPIFKDLFERWRPENGDSPVLRSSHLIHRTNMLISGRGRQEALGVADEDADAPDAKFIERAILNFQPWAAPITAGLRKQMNLGLFVEMAPCFINEDGTLKDITSDDLASLSGVGGDDGDDVFSLLSQFSRRGTLSDILGRGNPQGGSQGASGDDSSLGSASSLGLRSAGGSGGDDDDSEGGGQGGARGLSKAQMTPPARLLRFQVTRETPQDSKPTGWKKLKELTRTKELPPMPRSKHSRGKELCPSWVVNGLCDHTTCARAYDHKPYNNNDRAIIEMESWCTVCRKPWTVLQPLLPITEIAAPSE